MGRGSLDPNDWAGTGVEYRKAYEYLHELLSEGIEANGFQTEYEAISFLSSFFSYVMEKEFFDRFVEMFQEYYTLRDKDVLVTRVRYFMGDLIEGVSREAKSLGVSDRFITRFFDGDNRADLSHLASLLANKDLKKYRNHKDLKVSCLQDLFNYMSNVITATKLVEGPRQNLGMDLSSVAIVLISISFLVMVLVL